jgi:hypothetical protein
MKKTIKGEFEMKLLKLVVIITLVFIFGTSDVYGVFSYNRSCKAFPNNCGEGGGGKGNAEPLLEHLIIDAAGYYIQSNGYYQQLLNKIELSEVYGIDFDDMAQTINKALENMVLANALYFEIWQTAKNLAYDPVTIDKLKQFDYKAYQNEHGLDPFIFGKVEKLLKVGDVVGAYEKTYYETLDLVGRLESFQETLFTHQLPEIMACWRTNQLYFEAQLFGQYVSEVFFAIAK